MFGEKLLPRDLTSGLSSDGRIASIARGHLRLAGVDGRYLPTLLRTIIGLLGLALLGAAAPAGSAAPGLDVPKGFVRHTSDPYASIGKVQQPVYGDFHRRPSWKGRRPNGTQAQRELIFEIFAVDAANGVCGQRTRNRGAPNKSFGASLRTLRAVQSLIFHNSQPITRR